MDNILTVSNVTKTYTNHVALDDVSLEVPRGQVYGLLGPNGAGKTTLIRIINHITAPDKGSVIFNGHELCAADIVNIGYLPEERGLYKKMKVGDQALFFARLKGLSKQDATKALKEWFERLEITSWWDKKVEELSKGMAQKIQFIITVLHKPSLLIFDEPFSGFDPINANILKNEILKLRDEGATVIFSTHNMASVEEICDNITLINRSHNILSGNVADLRLKYADNTFEVAFTGAPEDFISAVTPMIKSVSAPETDRDHLTHMSVALKSAEILPSLIAAANSAVGLKAFSLKLPSMNDIFINAVNGTNDSLITPPEL